MSQMRGRDGGFHEVDSDSSHLPSFRRNPPSKSLISPGQSTVWTTRSSHNPSKGGRDYQVLQKLIRPDLTFEIHKHIVESDDHAFNADECNIECCKQNGLHKSLDDNCNETTQEFSMDNPPKLSAEKRRDHLHLLRRRKSRARQKKY
jgi:hypothetical protein